MILSNSVPVGDSLGWLGDLGVTWDYPPTDCEDWEWSYTEGTNLDAER